MIYTSARWADAAHTQVTGTDADGATETVAAEHSIYRLLDHGPVGFVRPKNQGGVGGVIAEFAPDIAKQITSAPYSLFGGPTLKEVFDGH